MSPWDYAKNRDYDTAVCAQFLAALPVTGAAVSVFSASLPEACVCATDTLAAKLDEMQFDLGEGPRRDAVTTRAPVLLADVRNSSHERWPIYWQALLDTDVQSLFIFPLIVGALNVGVVELYSRSPNPLSSRDQEIAVALADRIAWSLLDRILTLNARNMSPTDESSPLSRREIHQATGMVLVQLGLTATEALLRMRAHAFANDQSMRDVAREVVARTLVFTS
ncbi:GAF and ANTAR domain-containing protein [Cryobacterium roopkundense]|uniref:GAF domain-containing protein n=1 Tax=Cryobacterium roopkundense TaxID=1001240 RepID=A0A7W9E2E0_9MICO|nr:GAF and ANTAR domain-containing protein [Cryobacterium roopkundense]MBB5639983.1 GAF domain-containing protein [Cryobacterium roopkundense]